MTRAFSSAAAPRSRTGTVVGIAGFALALAAAAQVAIPLPGTPVPFTLQPLLVVLAGFWLGPAAAAASMALYVAAGALGLPVFAPMGAPGAARLIGPTGGYLLAYPVAAAVVALLARRADAAGVRGMFARTAVAVAGMMVLYAGGLAQLAILTGSPATAMVVGALPFAALDVLKSVLAAALAPRSNRLPSLGA